MEEEGRTKRFKCSMKTCKLTSSVKIAWPVPALAALPYMLADMCVVDGLSFESRKRACEPPWSQTMYRGMGMGFWLERGEVELRQCG